MHPWPRLCMVFFVRFFLIKAPEVNRKFIRRQSQANKMDCVKVSLSLFLFFFNSAFFFRLLNFRNLYFLFTFFFLLFLFRSFCAHQFWFSISFFLRWHFPSIILDTKNKIHSEMLKYESVPTIAKKKTAHFFRTSW